MKKLINIVQRRGGVSYSSAKKAVKKALVKKQHIDYKNINAEFIQIVTDSLILLRG